MAIWSSEIKELEKHYESLKGQLPDLEKEIQRADLLQKRTGIPCSRTSF